MSPVLLYPVKVILCSGILFGYYLLALRNNRFHSWNRYYLLLAVAASVIIPLLRLPLPFDLSGSSSGLQILPVYAGGVGEINIEASSRASSWIPAPGTLGIFLYCSIACLLAGRFVYSLLSIRSLIRKADHRHLSDYIFVNTGKADSPYSFFRYIFWNTDIDLQTPQGKKILQHELVHVHEKHTADKLFMEVIRIFFWFNPFFYLIRRELELIHEFIADTRVSEGVEDELYQQLLIFQALDRPQLAGVNHFFHHKIKRRLYMLTSSAQPRFSYLRRVMALPLAFVVLCAFSASRKSRPHLSRADKKITVVIDAGHGGADSGGGYGTIKEKNITLAIAKLIREKATAGNVKVILTREDDHYIPPAERAAAAAGADMFISLHVNTVQSHMAVRKQGFEAYIYKGQPGDNSLKLASAVLQSLSRTDLLVKDTVYAKKLAVLNTTCPAVLLEMGYLTSDKDRHYLMQEAGREQIAADILNAVIAYSNASPVNMAGFLQEGDTLPPSAERLKKLAPKDIKGGVNKQPDSPIVYLKNGEIWTTQSTSRKYVPPPAPPKPKPGPADTVKKMLNGQPVYSFVQQMPRYPGAVSDEDSNNKISLFLHDHIHYPKAALNEGAQGVITVTFVVRTDGSLQDIKTVGTLKGWGLEDEALRVVRAMPRWQPGKQDGHPVDVQFTLPVHFQLQ